MNRFLFGVLAATLLVFGAYSPARAGLVVPSHVFQAPLVTQLSDDSLEDAFAPNGTTPVSTITTGDILQGSITFHSIQESGVSGTSTALNNPGMQVTAFFSAVVTVSGSAPNFVLTLAPNPTFEATFGTGAMAVAFENDSGNPYNTRTSGTFSNYFTDAQTGTKLFTIGFTGAAGTPTGGEGWSSTVASLSTVPQAVQHSIGSFIANVDLVGSGPSFGIFNDPAQWNVAFQQGSFYGTGDNTQFAINGQLFTRQSGQVSNTTPGGGATPPANPFPVGDNSSVFFSPQAVGVPEPASLTLLVVGLAGIAGFRRLKKNPVA